ncbi:MAG: S1 family peptidase, partial [Bdellovibrionota bacterium]
AWSSTLYLKLDGGSCTGTLISPRFVLTAAHCGIHTPQRIGFYDGEKIIDTRGVVATTVHPGYTPDAETWDKYNDVALIQLDSPAPARFVPTPMLTSFNQIQTTALIAGYGLVGPKGLRNGLTSATMNVVGIDEKGFLIKFSDPTSKQSACPGDSGGPAYMKIGNQYYLAAVTSFIDAKDANCGDALHSTFSVLVINYNDWVKSVMGAAK